MRGIAAGAAFVALVLVGAHQVAAQPACSSTNDNSCAVYSDCIEANCNCNATPFSYPKNFGFKNCNKFRTSTALSPAGIQWRNKTLICLKDRISVAYVQNSANGCNCEEIQRQAIQSHTDCYISAPSFCSLPESDIRAIARIVDAPDFVALGTDGVIETAKTLYGCYRTVGRDKAGAVAIAFGDETLAEGGEIARGYLVRVMSEGERLARNAGLPQIADAFKTLADHYRTRVP